MSNPTSPSFIPLPPSPPVPLPPSSSSSSSTDFTTTTTTAAAATAAAAAALSSLALSSRPPSTGSRWGWLDSLFPRGKPLTWIYSTTALVVTSVALFKIYQTLKQRKNKAQPNAYYNHLQKLKKLKNRYFMIRHGESEANVSGIISSNPDISTQIHGLTEHGRLQVIQHTNELSKMLATKPNTKVITISSDFTRARETAALVHSHLRLRGSIPLFTQLRERSFGDLNGTSTENYGKIWIIDAVDPNHTEYNVESVNHVVDRTTQFIYDIETGRINLEEFSRQINPSTLNSSSNHSSDSVYNWNSIHSTSTTTSSSTTPLDIVMASHGDVCQILQTAFLDLDGSTHRQRTHWNNGEVRELTWPPKPEDTSHIQQTHNSHSTSQEILQQVQAETQDHGNPHNEKLNTSH